MWTRYLRKFCTLNITFYTSCPTTTTQAVDHMAPFSQSVVTLFSPTSQKITFSPLTHMSRTQINNPLPNEWTDLLNLTVSLTTKQHFINLVTLHQPKLYLLVRLHTCIYIAHTEIERSHLSLTSAEWILSMCFLGFVVVKLSSLFILFLMSSYSSSNIHATFSFKHEI